MQIFNAFSLTLWLTSERLSDIRERRALLKLAFTIKFSQNLNTQRGRVATTLTLRIYTILKGRTIYLASVSGCCLSICVGNARSLIVWMSKIQSSRFSHNNLAVPTEDEGHLTSNETNIDSYHFYTLSILRLCTRALW